MKKAFRANATVIAITDEEMQELQSSETAYADKLMPYLRTLSPDERLRLAKIGTANIDFTGVAIDYGRARPELVPPYADMEEAAANLALYNALRTLQQQRAATDRAIEDTMMQCGSAAYGGGLGVYDMSKAGAKKGLFGAVAIAQDLGARLPTRASRNRTAPKPVDPGDQDGGTAA
jgi:hypothetical protein